VTNPPLEDLPPLTAANSLKLLPIFSRMAFDVASFPNRHNVLMRDLLKAEPDADSGIDIAVLKKTACLSASDL